MAQRVRLDMAEIEKYYRVEEDGAIWSYKHERYVRQTRDYVGYVYVSLYPIRGMTSVHKVVAQKYLGDCPAGREVSHKDGNKMNNHWSNLEYITHSANLLKSFREHGRPSPPGNHLPPSVETKLLMSQAKKKPVYCTDGRSWGSVEECAEDIGRSRTAVWLSMREGREIEGVGGMLDFCFPARPPRPRGKKEDKKKKPVMSDDGRMWDSIQKCADDLGVDRRIIYRGIKEERKVRGMRVSFCSPA